MSAAIGHLLLYVNHRGGYYYHVAEWHGRPKYMTEGGYRRYLKEERKTELKRRPIPLPNPDGALNYLESLMNKSWT